MKLRCKENRCDTCGGYIAASKNNGPVCRNSGGVPISDAKIERNQQKGCLIWTPRSESK